MAANEGTKTTDREIDTALAERLFGWKWVAWKDQRYIVAPDEGLRDNEIWAQGDEDVWVGGTREVPHYSTDIGAAWLVVEKMRADGYAFDAGSWENMNDGNNWVAEFEHCSALLPVRGLGATMPEAICKAALACRAALAAVKGEGDDN